MKPQILELSEMEVCALLKALGKQPYEEVADLIGKIKSQCDGDDDSQSERVDFDE